MKVYHAIIARNKYEIITFVERHFGGQIFGWSYVRSCLKTVIKLAHLIHDAVLRSSQMKKYRYSKRGKQEILIAGVRGIIDSQA